MKKLGRSTMILAVAGQLRSWRDSGWIRTWRYSKLWALGAILLGQAALAACASLPRSSGDLSAATSATHAASPHRRAASKDDGADEDLARGLALLRAGEFTKASTEFNLGLKRNPQDPLLNYLNAYAYEQAGPSGDVEKLDLAQVGYELALKFDPSLRGAAVQLGYIALDRRDWSSAQGAFSRALEIDPDDLGVAYALAYASYYAGDLATAQAMIRRLPEGAADSPEILRTRAIIAAATGDGAAARRYLAAYDTVEPEPLRRQQLSSRVTRWGETLDWLKPQLTGPAAVRLAQQGQAAPGETQTPQLSPAPTPQELAPIKPDVPLVSSGQPSHDYEKMVIVDCIIIRREEVGSSSSGINLLDGLNLQYSGTLMSTLSSKIRDIVSGDIIGGTSQSQHGYVLTVPAVSYSLNIVNVQDSSSRIIGRPSIIAQDGEQSEFFMGSEVTYITSAGPATYGTSFSKEVGLTLRVRPDFLPDGHIRLTVDAEFLAFEPVAAGTFSQALQTAKNRVRVVATMDYDRTLVVGGGSETLETSVDNGVPVLRNVPLVQYLFSKANKAKTDRSLLILMTPRRPLSLNSADSVDTMFARIPGAERLPPEELRQLKDRYAAWFRPTSNLVQAMSSMILTPLYQEFRQGDLDLLDIDSKGATHLVRKQDRGQRMLDDALRTLYF